MSTYCRAGGVVQFGAMAAKKHGTRWAYLTGCRCPDCRSAQRVYLREYRQRKDLGSTRPAVVELPDEPSGPGPVELAVQAQLEELSAAQAQPALAAAALCMGRVLDGRSPTPKPQACAKLVDVLERLRKGSERRGSRLALVRAMSDKDGA